MDRYDGNTPVPVGAATDALAALQRAGDAVRANVGLVIVGKAQAIDLLLVTLLSEGHALIEDVPGLGKTVTAKALARSLDLSFARIQGTADLLEAMQERQVTADGRTRALPRPFLVIATQNPIELEGTFPLPEAQLDRFLLRLSIAYPALEEERAMLYRFQDAQPLDTLTPVLSGNELLALLPVVRQVTVAQPVADYVLGIVRATRQQAAVELGASPRAALGLFRAAQAYAAL